MRRILLFFICFGISHLLWTQELSWAQKQRLNDKVFDLIDSYQRSVEFRELTQPGLSPRRVTEFRELFQPDARLLDDINPSLQSLDNGVQTYVLVEKSLEEYIQDVLSNYPNGLRVDVTNVQVDFSKAKARQVDVYLSKEISGRRASGQSFLNRDTLVLRLETDADIQNVQIAAIEGLGTRLSSFEDRDLDGLLNEQDSCPDLAGLPGDGCPPEQPPTDRDSDGISDEDDECPDQAGPASLKGCPDRDKDGIADKYDRCPDQPGIASRRGCPPPGPGVVIAGALPSTEITLWVGAGYNKLDFGAESLANLGYEDEVDTPQSNDGGLAVDQQGTVKLNFGAEVATYFGSTASIGVGIGFQVQSFEASLLLEDDFHVQYRSTDQAGTDYNRMVTVRDLVEEVNLTKLFIPLTLRYRGAISEELGFFVHAGPVVDIQLSSSSTAFGEADYEAIYHYDEIGECFDFDPTNRPDSEDWLMTRANNSESYFTEQRQDIFDVGLDQSLSGDSEIDQELGIGALIRLGLYYRLADRVMINFSALGVLSSSSVQANNEYILTDKIGEYNSLANGLDTDKFRQTSFGVAFGLSFGF